jgi:hypothetical protein
MVVVRVKVRELHPLPHLEPHDRAVERHLNRRRLAVAVLDHAELHRFHLGSVFLGFIITDEIEHRFSAVLDLARAGAPGRWYSQNLTSPPPFQTASRCPLGLISAPAPLFGPISKQWIVLSKGREVSFLPLRLWQARPSIAIAVLSRGMPLIQERKCDVTGKLTAAGSCCTGSGSQSADPSGLNVPARST